jgi:putative pyruvate formate lyase activating enzyme
MIEHKMWKNLRPDAVTVLTDKMVNKSLLRYFAVMHDKKSAKFMVSKRLPAEFNENDSTEALWQKHADLTTEYYLIEKEIDSGREKLCEMPRPEKSYLDLKIEIANRILTNCHFCVRRCGASRSKGEIGYCRCGVNMAVSSIFEHLGEEPELVPSGTVFTMGCTMQCKHCQNYTISQWIENGRVYKPEELAEEIERLRISGCRNVNLVGGEPTPWLGQWLQTLKLVDTNVPVVWNSNSYYSPETAKLLAGFADVYLLDFKYGFAECSTRLSDAPNYWAVCTRNHLEAKWSGELIIRVLVLPEHLECCVRPILDWVSKNLGEETRINILFQYRPEWQAFKIPGLHRRLTRAEMKQAIEHAREAKLRNLVI